MNNFNAYLKSVSNRQTNWLIKQKVHYMEMCRVSVNLKFPQPSGPLWTCNRTALPLPYVIWRKTESCRDSGYESKWFKHVITLLTCLGEGPDADTRADGLRYELSSN